MTRKYLAAASAAAFALCLGLGLNTPAQASSFGCNLGDGCGTLHTTGHDLAGSPEAWDAKYQKPTEMVIGYPDNPGDSATSFDLVPHFTRMLTGWADTSLSLVPNPTALAFGTTVTGSASQPMPTTFVLSLAHLAASHSYNFSVTGASFYAGPTTGTFTSDASGNFTSSPFPFSIAGDTFHPGKYPVTITINDGSALVGSATVNFFVHAHPVTTPSAYWTIVLAKDGFWSNDCVTDPGSGNLRLEPCTLGRQLGQRFSIYAATDLAHALTAPGIRNHQNAVPWVLKNQLPGAGFVTANLAVDSSQPQPDSFDTRQLNDRATVLSAADEWLWNT